MLPGVQAALAVGHFLGTEPVKTGLLAGLSTLAVVAWTAGLPAAATAGNAAAVPALVAAANPAYAAAAPAATVLVAASVVVTMLSVPLVTAWRARRVVSTV